MNISGFVERRVLIAFNGAGRDIGECEQAFTLLRSNPLAGSIPVSVTLAFQI